jgi:ABC-type amino acid transport substrate-binding protein
VGRRCGGARSDVLLYPLGGGLVVGCTKKGSVRVKKYVSAVLFLLLCYFVSLSLIYADAPVRVGVYQNEPLVFIDDDGNAQGFYIDVLKAIAAEEGWHLEYAPCSWPECLERLERGEIDLLVAIAYSAERDERFDFTSETILSNWGQVYTQKNAGIQSILDLEGRTIAVLKGDIYYTGFRDIVDHFDIDCDFVAVEEYAAVFELVDGGKVDAGLMTRLYGLQHERDYAVDRSPILCCPVELRFAVPEGRNQDLVNALDRRLAALKDDQGSVYYKSLNRWFGGISEAEISPWLKWALALAGGLLLFFLGASVILRAQVRARTRALEE